MGLALRVEATARLVWPQDRLGQLLLRRSDSTKDGGLMHDGETVDIPGCRVLAKIEHPRQRHHTWLVRYRGADAVAKRYRLLSTHSVAELYALESPLRSAGVAVPELVYRSPDAPLAAHARVAGGHVTSPTPSMIADCLGLTSECGILRPEARKHAHTAALYMAAVRLAEDQRRGVAAVSSGELRKALGGTL